MILHLVLFKLHEPFRWCDHEVIDAEASTRQHPLYIKEILGWACGRNISSRNRAVDFAVMGLFDSQDALSEFLIHPHHQQGVSKWQKIASWQVVDMAIVSGTAKLFVLINQWVASSLTLE